MRYLRYALFALGLLVFVTVGGAFGGYVWLVRALDAPGPAAEPVTLVVPPGAGLARIADQLAGSHVVSGSLTFRLGARLEGKAGSLKAGEYQFPAGASMRDVLDQLVSGRVVIHSLTFPEGLTTRAILDLLRESDVLTGDITLTPPEGALLPETFHVTRGETRDSVLRRMGQARTEALDTLWKDRAPDLPFSTPEQALVLASIVEKETGMKGERPRVAAVFINRLRKGMPLQSDPTTIYGLSDGLGRLSRDLTRQDLQADHPWNTYVHAGLPPGPICNPGIASIRAVLHPENTRELYFVADGTGGHAFAETLEEHNRNVRAWRRLRAEQPSPAPEASQPAP
ncbi:endolytic transglycosylase MltG [Phaeovibrio sulfidiphilus]|uniref:Endolytic murein transglycosylase n=1 Tax=Phaeovibrio sulfidiphilus TaxID=1220600 RepID=A0A8J6YLP6_9PROT|nr:endolytic transglycosylase MltG [Phaeovibrio sulfidiphilus]MBE1236883.1 endolytic transglycosylase MltG [Phaeovibrio sulfidiphilus]